MYKEVDMGHLRKRFPRLRGMFRSGDVVNNSESVVVNEPLMDVDAMARQIIEARYGFVTTFIGLPVMEDKTLGPDEYVIRVGSKLFSEIQKATKKI